MDLGILKFKNLQVFLLDINDGVEGFENLNSWKSTILNDVTKKKISLP